MHLTASSVVPSLATVAVDVSAYKLNLMCRDLSSPGAAAEWEIANRTQAITSTLLAIWERAQARGITNLRIVVEPTGIYHKLLLRIAASLGFETGMVDAGHVKMMRSVLFGDDGKTDRRDPYAIEAVAAQGRLIADRRHAEVYSLLRQWGKIYSDAEAALIDAKSRVHRALTLLFPDFDFTTDFLYGPSGKAIVRCFGLDPHAIATLDASRIHARLRKHSRILRSSVVRLLAQARQTVAAVSRSRVTDLHARDLAFAWEDFEHAARRRQTARQELEALYDDARMFSSTAGDRRRRRRLEAGHGSPPRRGRTAQCVLELATTAAHGRSEPSRAEERQVCRPDQDRTHRPAAAAGDPQSDGPASGQARSSVRLLLSPQAGVQKMPGAKAMTAVSRKIVKMIWGWYRSGEAFDAGRVFTCAGEHRRAA